MKYGSLILASFVLISLLLIGNVQAIEDTTVDLTISPGAKDGAYLPVLYDSDTVDVKVTSNVPVDVYIITSAEVPNAVSSDDFDYEKKWSDKTSLNVDYKVENRQEMYYIMIHNTDDSETANVELEYKIYQEIAEDIIEDAAEDACCGGTLLFITISLISLVLIGALVRSIKNQ